ncbi:Dihydroorotate dehydrogenase B (NAD(+)), catalytic subunit [Planctomycetes bacterium MalM25]|nr:Dihydroorotate dehydrogenase B (NAD(+)), catalytic subunit [Planctomycetes bacterium MalM25]
MSPGPGEPSLASVETTAPQVDLTVTLGRLRLPNPVMVASGTFGYARELASLVDLSRLGGILPKTVTATPREGNAPWRTVETSAGMLNAIGLDNDGVDAFLEHHLPYLASVGAPIVVSVAGRTGDEFVDLVRRFAAVDSSLRPAAIELNLSCPNVSGGVDFGSDPAKCEAVVRDCVAASDLPILAKLTPNVTSVPTMAKAAEAGGCDAITLINTVLGMGVDWRNQKPLLANVVGGLSGPAIKPIALRCVYQAAGAVSCPIVGVGGAATLDDVMEFLVAGASAVQLGTVNFYRPQASMEMLDGLPTALAELNAASVSQVVGSLATGKS